MRQAFFKVWIGVIVLLLILGGILAWQFWPKKVTPPLTEKMAPGGVIEDETANWKTYRNEEGGYLSKYPKEWNAVTNKYHPTDAHFGPGATSEGGNGGAKFAGTLLPGQSLKDFVKARNASAEAGSISETETIINGQTVIISILLKAAIEPTEVKSVCFEKDR